MSEKDPSICEEENYNQLFHRYYESVTKYIYYKCGNLQQAEDIVQNVFVKLWQLCATISFSKAKSYIYTACNNLFLNEVAHNKVVLKYKDQTTKQLDVESPDFILETSEFETKLQAAIDTLSSKDREVFLLSRIEKKTYMEIAEIVGVTVKAVERRMSKALLELRSRLGKELKI